MRKIFLIALPAFDDATFALLARGDLEGIFQLEIERACARFVRRSQALLPSKDPSILACIGRPVDAGLIPSSSRKHGREGDLEFAVRRWAVPEGNLTDHGV